jgi:hypothetical protein
MRPRLGIALAAAALGLAAAAPSAPAATKWLCKPGQAKNPCTLGFSTTVYSNDNKVLRTEHPKAKSPLPADCFYVYPTVSDQKTVYANTNVDPEIRSIAVHQGARFSERCRVYAPLYRQVTIQGLNNGGETPQRLARPLADVRRAFQDYLQNYNKGRPFVLIGHSQGSFVLTSLIQKDVDAKPAVRALMLSAMLLGGDIEVKKGTTGGGDFKHVPLCRSKTQLGCLIAYSSFDAPVPDRSFFGRAQAAGRQVACTNPAALGGGTGTLDTIFPSEPFAPGTSIAVGIQLLGLTQPRPATTWVRYPSAFKARCSTAGGASVLQITPQPGAQVPKASPSPEWGLHLMDVNAGLGNLVGLVGSQTTAFAKRAAKGR